MGPNLFSVKREIQHTLLRAIPLGGYVRMEGEEQASDNESAYNRKPLLVRAAVIAAGPIMNLVFAVLFFFIVFSYSGYSTFKN